MTTVSCTQRDRRAERLFFCISLTLALWLTLVTYPGVFYSDTYARWAYAKELLARLLSGTLSGYASYLSHAPQFVLAVFYALTGNPASYTLFQCFFLYYSTYLLLWRVVAPRSRVCAALATVFPALWGYGVYQEMGVSTLIGFNCLALLLFDAQRWAWAGRTRLQKVLYGLGVFGACYMLFGFRQNSLTLIPVFAASVFVFFKAHPDRKRLVVSTGAAVAAVLAVTLLPAALGFSQKYDASRPGMVWEVVSAVNAMPDEQAADYADYFDDLFGAGVTADMLARNAENNESINPIWGACDIFTIGSPENRGPVLQKYLDFAKAEPGAFLRNKWSFALRTLGVEHALRDAEYGYNPAELMGRYGLSDTTQRVLFFKAYVVYDHCNALLRRPFLLYLAAIALAVAERIVCGKKRRDTALFFLLSAIFYYGAFLLNNQSFEFRYFYPAMMMLLFGIAGSVCSLWRAIRGQTVQPESASPK